VGIRLIHICAFDALVLSIDVVLFIRAEVLELLLEASLLLRLL
jgi:hypothetical protein